MKISLTAPNSASSIVSTYAFVAGRPKIRRKTYPIFARAIFSLAESLSRPLTWSLSLALTLSTPLTGSIAYAATDEPAPPQVMSAESIFGNAKIGYLAAKKIPDICGKLFCYCGCDGTDNHSTLLDCFTSDHGVDCSICQEEAIMALKMNGDGKSLADIQKTIDQKYVAEYNEVFTTPSSALLKYRQQRLWKPTPAEQIAENTAGTKVGGTSTDGKGNKESGSTSSAASTSSTGSKKSSGAMNKSGSCCGGHK